MEAIRQPGNADADCWIIVEGGGSRTTVVVTGPGPGRADGDSTNPRSVGPAQAARTLRDLVAAALAAANTRPDAVTFAVASHGAASTTEAAYEFAHLLDGALRQAGVAAPVAVTGDILPLLFSVEATLTVAVIVGTGTEYLARHGTDRFAVASGLDYLLTDEGGGFDLGLQGLRAVARALDGRGPATALTASAGDWCGRSPSGSLREDLFRKVHQTPARPTVASFARSVLAVAAHGDPVATALVDSAVGEVLVGVRTVLRAVGADGAQPTLILSGSLASTDNAFRERLLSRLVAELAEAQIVTHDDSALAPAVRRLGELVLRHRDDLGRLRRAGPVVLLGSEQDASPRGAP
ncbi:BadF/BadG/BcrA/BcrD ATPase family protein [Micromonospora sp. NPDC050495]|uniref:N-acetylglucosamine kinase n=1 Tax=Micromonospora sp. NPDC050495 TaxID=3154936 RepID=UPI0033C2447C